MHRDSSFNVSYAINNFTFYFLESCFGKIGRLSCDRSINSCRNNFIGCAWVIFIGKMSVKIIHPLVHRPHCLIGGVFSWWRISRNPLYNYTNLIAFLVVPSKTSNSKSCNCSFIRIAFVGGIIAIRVSLPKFFFISTKISCCCCLFVQIYFIAIMINKIFIFSTREKMTTIF